jgi:hypothetical protein
MGVLESNLSERKIGTNGMLERTYVQKAVERKNDYPLSIYDFQYSRF